ncbi:hypothetical protein [Streptomyces glaucus]|uniref:Uncharacterized protein n=1 Tax=Streptomyces glaucus TaxID=284029 RepID=A0ABN3JVE2_9ACTN
MTTNAETPRVVSGAFPEDSAAGGKSAAIVEQSQRRREAAGCGRPDDAQNPGPEPQPATIDQDAFVELWATAKTLFFARDFPKYASPEWRALHPDDPRRLAGALEAAEMWRKYGDEQELCEWLKRLSSSPEAVLRARALAELDALAKPKPPHQLRAAPGWPPVRIPGQPGKYLDCTRKEAA